jgi:ABC-type dipeptide/oligopeptide/nickel transport system permease subunit
MILELVFRWARRNIVSSAGIILAFGLVISSLTAPILPLNNPAKQDLSAILMGPSSEHLLGTDHLGRDILSRLMWAGRSSIIATSIVLLISLILGMLVGIISGYFGGFVDSIFMRVTDIFLSLPTMILALALIGALGPGFENLILALSVGWWPSYARLVRSKVLIVKTSDYVRASETLGASDLHVMRQHLLPALVGPAAVLLSLDVGDVILSIAALGFLGLGVQPPAPEWGTMLVDARPFMQSALHLVFPPGLAILIIVFGFNSLGETLDHWLNQGL